MKNFGKSSLWIALLLLMWFENNVTGADGENKEDTPHSRQKRLLWITTDGRLALPPGTRLTITPSLSLPFVRYPPDGFLSNMSISLPFTSKFNGFSDMNISQRWGTLVPIKEGKMGKTLSQKIGVWSILLWESRALFEFVCVSYHLANLR